MSDKDSERIKMVKERLKPSDRCRDSRPLHALAQTEKDLHNQSANLAISNVAKNAPDVNLLVYQLTRAVHSDSVCGTMKAKFKGQAIAAYNALQPVDMTESILARHLIVASAGAMECLARAMLCSDPAKTDIYLRHYEKMTRLTLDIIDARESRRRPRDIRVGNVNNVNVEAGLTIVGKVEPTEANSDAGNSDLSVPAKKKRRRRNS